MLRLFSANTSPGGSDVNPGDLSTSRGFKLLVVMSGGLLWVLSLLGLGVLSLFG